MLRAFFVVVAIVGIAFASPAQADDRRDGNYWQGQQRLEKLNYVTGFFDGVSLGYSFSYWGNLNKKKFASVNDTQASYREYEAKFLTNVTSGQLTDGLDEFYKHFENRSILLPQAVWLVLNQIAGTPNVDTMILNFRRNAN